MMEPRDVKPKTFVEIPRWLRRKDVADYAEALNITEDDARRLIFAEDNPDE